MRIEAVATPAAKAPAYDLEQVRAEFPVLAQTVWGKPLVYLDSAATAQKPRAVLAALASFYGETYASVNRGVHLLSANATAAHEAARETVRRFLNADSAAEIVFVRNTTEAINLVAASFLRSRLAAGDEILITALEHHSNILPWQQLAAERGARLVVAPIDDRGEVILEEYERRLGARTRMAAIAHVSNALGTVNPVATMIAMAHAQGVPVLVDGAQAAPHLAVDVRALECDFYAFSGHKTYGPTGIGALYGKSEHLERMPPYQPGGGTIRRVTFEATEYDAPPHRFEGGTPAVAEAIGLARALDFLTGLGLGAVAAWEQELLAAATEALAAEPGVRILGQAREKAAVLSFLLDGIHPHDVGTVLDHQGVAVRAGHHCAQPVMDRFGVPATVRASFGLYNSLAEVEVLVAAVHKAREVFGN